jgi:asparagine synthase (glutamine-hydrolysing)
MLITLFQRHEHAIDGAGLSRCWHLPESAIRYRSRHCVIATDGATSFARTATAGIETDQHGIVAVFDGRLDNRPELLRACSLREEGSLSDAALLCAVYERFGEDCTAQLTGDFRFVLVDERARLLLASVDFACSQRLWWRERGSLLVIASGMAELYSPDETLQINEDYLIERLAYGWNSGREGPFVGSARFQPGETLRAGAHALSVRRYWCPTMFVAADSATRTEAACVEEFGRLLRDAVHHRIPRAGTLLCELSGGLDSTSVTAFAGSLLRDAPGRLHAVTVSYPGSPRTDERRLAATVATAAGAIHHIVEWDAAEPLYRGMPENAYYWDEPRFNVHSHAMALAKDRLLQSIGARVVLTGMGAEPLLCEDMQWPVFLADSLIRGRWRELYGGLITWQGARKSSFVVLVYRSCIAPLVRPISAMTYEGRQVAPPWVTARARRRFEELRAAQLKPIVNRRNSAGAWMAEQWQAAASCADQGYGAYAYESRFPYLHKPLVESVLRMPWSVRRPPEVNKFLLRRLAAELLPPGFATRMSSAADQAVGRALAAQDARLRTFVTGSALAQLGLVDEARLQRGLTLAQNGFGRGLRFLVTTMAIELWTHSVVSGEWRRMRMEHLWPGRNERRVAHG